MATFSLKVFLREARRRRVFRVTAIYVVGAWVVLQAADLAFPGFGIEESAILYVWIGAILGLPIALFFGWRYDIIGGRIVRTAVSDVDADLSLERTDYIIIAALSVVVAVIVFGVVGEISNTRAPDEARSSFTEIDPKSIAVLPFRNMSDDPEQEYFSDGIAEEILHLLVKVPELRVISRSSAFSFKGQNLDVPTMADKLNVAHVLEGSVRKSGKQLRITAQLIEVATDTHLWSGSYDRELKSVFAIQDEIAAAVVGALKITLLGEEPKTTETSPEAYALYLQGRHVHQDQVTAESHKQAETLQKQALAIDPGFAPAWTELGIVYSHRATGSAVGLRARDKANELARDAIQKALAIDPQYGRAYAALAEIELLYDWDFTAAGQHMQQALELNPGDTYILFIGADVKSAFGRHDEAIDLYRQMIALDPVSPEGHISLGWLYLNANRLAEAADSFQLGLSLTPGRTAHIGLVVAMLLQGDAPAALTVVEQLTGDFRRLQGMALVRYALGDAEASDAALQELIDKYGASNGAFQVAEVYTFRGEVDHAFDWLQRAYDNRDTGMPFLLDRPLLANLHDDPRWGRLLDKMGLPH